MALRKVLRELFISSTKGSFTGYRAEPQSTECSRMWNTPVSSQGWVWKAMPKVLFSSARSSHTRRAPDVRCSICQRAASSSSTL